MLEYIGLIFIILAVLSVISTSIHTDIKKRRFLKELEEIDKIIHNNRKI